MRTLFAILCLVACATGFAAEVPLACQVVPGKVHEPFADLTTGTLPLPDYLDVVHECLTFAPPGQARQPLPPTPSAWLDSEHDRYATLLASQPVDVLVVPFQVQGYGLDRIERAVMTADLAYAIGDGGTLRVADPFHVALALGEGLRRIDPTAVLTLARKIGARKIVSGYVGHDGKHTFTLTLKVRDLSSGNEDWQRDWRSVSFSDGKTPAYVMHDMLASIVPALPLGLKGMPLAANAVAQTASSPARISVSPLDLVSSSKRPDAPAPSGVAVLSLLGTLVPELAELPRERLFERALVASLRANVGKPENRFLEAYALHNLHRRPVALARIAGASTPSLVALRALLDGNLPAARTATREVKQPFEQFLLQLGVRDLEYDYRMENDTTEPTAAEPLFAESVREKWAPLLVVRVDDHYTWATPNTGAIKKGLDDAFPNGEFDLAGLTHGKAARAVDEVDIDIANMRHVLQAGRTLELGPCCRTGDLKPGKWDLLWVLQGMSEARIGRELRLAVWQQGQPRSAIDAIARYEPLMKGHPMLSAMDGIASSALSDKAPDDTRANWSQRAKVRALDALEWAQGQNTLGYYAVATLKSPDSGGSIWLDAYSYDYPHRSFWPIWFLGVETQPGLEVRIAHASEALAFSSNDPTPLDSMRDRAGAARASLGARFTGHFKMKELATTGGRPLDGSLASLRAAAKRDPERNMDLGYQLLYSGRPYEEAQSAFLAYPQFRASRSRDRVELSNEAYDVGARFFWLGQGEIARPFFKIAADLGTGSEASLNSEQRLLQLAGDLRGASAAALRRALRYSAGAGYRDHLSLLHAFGEHDAAWSTFARIRASMEDPTPWTSALVGHRMQGLDDKGLRAWVTTPEIRDARFKTQRFASYYALLWNVIDRTPPADLGALVEQLDGQSNAFADANGAVMLLDAETHVAESVARNFTPEVADPAAKSSPGAIKSERAYFANAYGAVARGEYESASERFIAMAWRYPVDEAAMPYFAYAASKTGDKAGFEKYVDSILPGTEPDFDALLAQAFFAAGHKKTDDAYRLLDLAFRAKPFGYGVSRQVEPHYQFAQACEWLYRDTKDPRFVVKLLEWAKGYEMLQPAMAWPYAVEYQYAKDPQARTRGLALALYLDPASERIHQASSAELEQARAWLVTRNPFRVKGAASVLDTPSPPL